MKTTSNYARKDNAGGHSSVSLSKQPILSMPQFPLQDELGLHNVLSSFLTKMFYYHFILFKTNRPKNNPDL